MESPALSEFDLHLFAEGRHWHIYNVLGAHLGNQRGIEGARFAVWAPNAQAVSVIGDFNDPHAQTFLSGHKDNVTCLALSPSVCARVENFIMRSLHKQFSYWPCV